MESTSFAALSLMSLVSFSSLQASPSSRVELDTYEISHLEIPTAAGSISLDVPAGLSSLKHSYQQGFLVLSWSSEASSLGQLTLPSRLLNLSLSPGKGALVVSPSGQVFRYGAVEAFELQVCGPQGARCPVLIAEWKNPAPHTCGPQGAMCPGEGPTLDLDDTLAVTGPNR